MDRTVLAWIEGPNCVKQNTWTDCVKVKTWADGVKVNMWTSCIKVNAWSECYSEYMDLTLLRWIDWPNCAKVNAWAELCKVEYLHKLCSGEYMDRNVTLRSGVLPEKLIVVQIVKKSPTLYGTWMFITAFTRTRHVFLFLFNPYRTNVENRVSS